MWGGTLLRHGENKAGIYFNPPTPCGVGHHLSSLAFSSPPHFNPPTPCGVGQNGLGDLITETVFQSTHPVWGGTQKLLRLMLRSAISIHPPRVGWDDTATFNECNGPYFNPPTPCGVGPFQKFSARLPFHFNPPTPCGVGPRRAARLPGWVPFQSTHPVWGGTAWVYHRSVGAAFQSTHPVWGGTQRKISARVRQTFQSTHPVWGGTMFDSYDTFAMVFQSTHPVWGGTSATRSLTIALMISIHPPRVGWDYV